MPCIYNTTADGETEFYPSPITDIGMQLLLLLLLLLLD